MSVLSQFVILFGLLAVIAGGVWLTVLAFRENTGWGLTCALCPVAWIPFMFLHSAKAAVPGSLLIVGLALMLSGGILYSNTPSPLPKTKDSTSPIPQNSVDNGSVKDLADSKANVQNSNQHQPPPDSEDHFARAMELLVQNRFDEAIERFSKSIAQTPKNDKAYNGRANALVGKGDYRAADSDYATALTLVSPDDHAGLATVLIGRAAVLNELGSYDEAIPLCDRAIPLSSETWRALAVRAFAYNGLREFKHAIEDCNASIQLEPSKPWTYVSRGIAYFFDDDMANEKNLNAAIRDFTEAIGLNPNIAQAYHFRGRTYHRQNQTDKAFDDYAEAIRLNPNDAISFFNRGLIWEKKGDLKAAINDSSEAIRINSQLYGAYATRGRARKELQQYDDALSDFDQALKLNPADAYSLANRAMIWMEKGDYDAAVADCSDAIRLQLNDAHIYHVRARALRMQELLDDAIRDYSHALELDQSNVHLLTNRGLALLANGRTDAAIKDFSDAIRLDTKDSQLYFLRGIARKMKRSFGEAIKDFGESIRLDEQNAQAINWLARVYAACPDNKLRDGKKAIELATKACELTDWKNGSYIDTLAAACAETRNWDQAVQQQEKAIEAAETEDARLEATNRRDQYKQRKPFREANWKPVLPKTIFE